MADIYKEVRSLSRGIKLIETLAELGWVKPGALSKYAALDRSTVYRLINTLIEIGYVSRREEDGAIALTSKLMQVANGIRNDDLIVQSVEPHIQRLTEKILWPSDFAVFSAGSVSIKASTHNISPMSVHRAMIGKERPLLRSAIGKALLFGMNEKELEHTLNIVSKLGGMNARDAQSRKNVNKVVGEVRKCGYASAIGSMETNISAIALPVRSAHRVIGAINIIFFRNVLSPVEAAEKYLKSLTNCIDDIEVELNTKGT